jgi:MoaA/NifB/PqqE/SkfB family radical SAM enzyme
MESTQVKQAINMETEQSGMAEVFLKGLTFLELELTAKCNLTCTHCYAESGPRLPLRQGMSYQDWHKIILDGYTLGCRAVQFVGGEPTLHPDLPALVEAAHQAGYEVIEVFTNGTVLNQNMLKVFKACNVTLAFSIYGSTPAIHDAVTTQKGSHRKTVAGIRRALAIGLEIRVAVVEMQQNQADIEATKALLQEIGVKTIKVDPMRRIGRGVVSIGDKGKMEELCGACWLGLLAVDPSGNVFPCIFSRFKKIGHVSQGLADILQQDELKQFRQSVREMHKVTICAPAAAEANSLATEKPTNHSAS